MKAKFCLPIIKNSPEEVVKEIKNNLQNFSMFEIWIDYISKSDDVLILIKDLSHKLNNKLIINFRRKNGEAIVMNLEERKNVLHTLKDTKVFVDLDIEKQKQDLEFMKQEKLKLNTIVSFHDYEKTPRTSALVKIIEEMSVFEPTIYKIATFCQTEKQAISLLHLLLDLQEQKKTCIVLGMGKLGQITRIFGSLWGNEIIFAPISTDEESAPDQLTKEQLEKIFSIITIERN